MFAGAQDNPNKVNGRSRQCCSAVNNIRSAVTWSRRTSASGIRIRCPAWTFTALQSGWFEGRCSLRSFKQRGHRVAAAMRHLKRILDAYVVLQSAFVLSCCSAESEPGPGAGNGDRFKIEGRAIVSGVKAQDWVSSARVLVEGGEYIGFLR